MRNQWHGGGFELHEIFQQWWTGDCWLGEKATTESCVDRCQWVDKVLCIIHVHCSHQISEIWLYNTLSYTSPFCHNGCLCTLTCTKIRDNILRIFWIWFRLYSSSAEQNWNCWAEICYSLQWWEKKLMRKEASSGMKEWGSYWFNVKVNDDISVSYRW